MGESMGERGASTGRMRRMRRSALLASAVLLATGCVGSIDRSKFDEIVRERGGGLSGDLIVDALAAIEDHEEAPTLEVIQVSLSATSVTVSVRSPAFPDEVDGWTFTLGHHLNGPSPQPDLTDGQAVATFEASAVDAATIEASIDQAVVQTAVRGGWAESAFVRGTGGGAFEVQVSITNERADETWLFDGEGNLKGTQ